MVEANASVAGYDGDADEKQRVMEQIARSEELRKGAQELSEYARAFVTRSLLTWEVIKDD